MPDVRIENPILNSPFTEPRHHFRFTEDGITNEVVESRRFSSYFVPIPRSRKRRGSQMILPGTEWTLDRIQENQFINRIRGRVDLWRRGGYVGVTRTTARLLQYWTNPEREKKLFFCQIEALETAIYITEVARRYGDAWIENELQAFNNDANPGLYRIAFKMATGSGKTVVMGMLIAWQALNKLENPQDARFSDAFLIVTPGITIRDRLRVLLPSDPQNYYRQRDLLPPDLMERLGEAKIVITNFHAFKPRELVKAGKLTKALLAQSNGGALVESPGQVVRRVCRPLGNKKNIVVLNDEAHHCYRHRPEENGDKLKGDEREEAEKREEYARVWISGLEAVKAKLGIRAVYDLSATPFFLRGSGYDEGTLFPWVVSDFSLIDAIESGIVKVPRVPVADDAMTGDLPTYRDLWLRIRDDLPKKGRKDTSTGGVPYLPAELEGALKSLYGNYERYYRAWQASESDGTPPVMIVVCNNTSVSNLVYRYIAGWEKTLADGSTVLVPGQLPIFSNVQDGRWLARPSTILIDSEQLESGEGMSDDFKKLAALEIEVFKDEYRERFPDRSVEAITDEDLLREVMNTVGKPGKLGEPVKCVVSVSMLTEGWDANTVTHILGVRAFGTQLLCEQVVGRGLRRMSYALNAEGRFDPEYAEVYGVPFSFIPASNPGTGPKPGPKFTRVHALDDRRAAAITFPRLLGYRYDLPDGRLDAVFTDDSRKVISTLDVPTRTELSSILGELNVDTLDALQQRRVQEVDFALAKEVLERYFRDDDGHDRPWLFPQVLGIVKRWRENGYLDCHDNTYPQLLLITQLKRDAAGRIYRAISQAAPGQGVIKPILRPYDTVGSTEGVDFDTTRTVWATDPRKCHVSHVVGDTDTWEQKLAQALEELPEVVKYVKNDHLGFTMPYTVNGEERQYTPDFIACLNDGQDDLLNLVIEVSGQGRKDKEAKVATARSLWVPAVNQHGGFGRWAFIEIDDPWNAKHSIHALLEQPA